MAPRFATICRQFSNAAAETATDAELLARFATVRDETAFAAIVRRHGPMVWNVSRNLLANATDADDVFQATFLALVRAGKSVRRPEALGAWLHGVAVRAAKQLQRTAARRARREKASAGGESELPVADSRWDRVLAAVHEEVDRLPDGERTAFIVCCLEGVRQPDAAAQLGWKPGTLTVRLSRAKQRLLDRLTRRGLTLASASGALGLGATTAQSAVPGQLVDSVLNFAANAGTAPASLLQLSRGATDMTIAKIQWLAATVMIAGGLAIGGGAGWFANADAQAPKAPKAEPKPDRNPEQPLYETPAGPGRSAPFVPRTDSGVTGMPPDSGTNRPGMHRPWDYRFVEITGIVPNELKTLLEKEGATGWELAGIDLQKLERSSPEKWAILKRQRMVSSPGGSGMMGPGSMSGLPGPGSSPRPPVSPSPPAGEPTPPPATGRTGNKQDVPGGRFNPLRDFPASGSAMPPAVKLTLHTIPLQASKAGSLAKVLKELIADDEFQGEVTSAIAEDESNTLVLKASEAGKKLVIALIERFDETAARRRADEKRERSSIP